MNEKQLAILTTGNELYGFRLAGVLAYKAEANPLSAEKKVRELLNNEEIGVLALDSEVVAQLKPEFVKWLTVLDEPVVVTLPKVSAKEATLTEKEELESLIKHALGVKISF